MKPSLEVILRTHSTSDVHPGVRVVGPEVSKLEVIRRSLRSLAFSLSEAHRAGLADIKLSILDDHSSPETVSFLEHFAAALPFSAEVYPLEGEGNAVSLAACFVRGRASNADLLYFVEDDYLHVPEALSEMLESYALFSKNLGGRPVALFPADDPSFYRPNTFVPSRVVTGSHRHWRTNVQTTCTFFLPRSVLEMHYPVFEELTRNGVDEGSSINRLWQGPVTLFTPLPSLAAHLQFSDCIPPLFDWKSLWERYAIEPRYV
ncbi:glycosyltransferase family 2 protein [Candidatus Parcubacteria bacterium]|nr:glycosyltransferase family 2 protein [Candidatus Parcubacteria bacterium]